MKIPLFFTLAWSPLLLCSMLVLAALICSAKGAGYSNHHDDWPVRDQETIQKTLPLAQSPMRLVIDNVEGYVHVTGVSGSEVRITAHKIIRAETDSDLAQAKSEVKLDITDVPGTVTAYYDAPWRCDGEKPGCHSSQRRFYSVTYDIDVEAPSAARLVVSSVNNGDVRIDKASGDFEVSDINGGIEMSEIAGSGTVHTINGPVSVHFTKSPAAACSFKSINGSLDVWFPPQLAADLLFKVFNGQVYSDFDVSPRAIPAAATTDRKDGKFIYHSHGVSGGRAGGGGPELSFDTLNGSIRLHREQ
jgi:hypothetical protein